MGGNSRDPSGPIFEKTALVYGLEMLEFIAVIWTPNTPIGGKTATFHMENENAVKALVKTNAHPEIITETAQLSWYRTNQLGATPWFGWVPPNRNIADLPTSKVILGSETLGRKEFPNLRPLSDLTTQSVVSLQTSRSIPIPKFPDR